MFDVNTPTDPIQTRFVQESGVQVYMKRDDLIHPFISGNKWRKLKFNVEKVLHNMHAGIVTFGGAYSNHLIATACACATAGIPSVGVVRGDELDHQSNYVLRLCHEFGMELKFVSRKVYKDKDAIASEYKKKGYWVVPEGGANEEGVRGCEEIIGERAKEYDHLVVAVGTSTTLSGVIRSSAEESLVHGIAALKDASYLEDSIRTYTSRENWKLHLNYARDGFGKFNDELLGFNRSFASETGILLDPVYTGKMMMAVYDLIETGVFKSGDRVLCIHTGGMTGVLNTRWLKSHA